MEMQAFLLLRAVDFVVIFHFLLFDVLHCQNGGESQLAGLQ
jgi:hypothetical protein